MNLYLDSSVLVEALLTSRSVSPLRAALDKGALYCSRLTLAEAARTIRRRAATGELGKVRARNARRMLQRVAARVRVVELEPELLRRAGEPFRVEPVRTLDAIHLATALALDAELGDVVVASTDRRVRENAVAYRLGLQPPPSQHPAVI